MSLSLLVNVAIAMALTHFSICKECFYINYMIASVLMRNGSNTSAHTTK